MRMEELEYLSDEELLRRSIIREDGLERDKARESASSASGTYYTLR